MTIDPAPSTPSFNPRMNSTVARKRPRSRSPEVAVEVLMSEVFGDELSPSQAQATLSEATPQATLTEVSNTSQPASPAQATLSELSNPEQLATPCEVLSMMSGEEELVTSQPAAGSEGSIQVTPPPPHSPFVLQPRRNIWAATLDLTLTSPEATVPIPAPVRPPPPQEIVTVRLRKNARKTWSSIDVSVKIFELIKSI